MAGFKQAKDGSLEVLTKSGKTYPADIVILAIGVRPETALAKMAGLEIGQRGGIRVDEQMRTSDPDIFAVGDAVEVKDFVTGRMVTDSAGRTGEPSGTNRGRCDCRAEFPLPRHSGHLDRRVFGAAVASTGVNEKLLTRLGEKDYEKVYLFPNSHAGYYPGAKTLGYESHVSGNPTAVSLGAQVLGQDGVRSGSIPWPWRSRWDATVYDLEEAELCYAPPFGSAKDPVNFAGHGSRRMSCGATCRLVTGTSVGGRFLLDVRNPPEIVVESVPGAVNIPLPELRARLGELPRDREILIICRSAQRAYYATRILLQNGFKARNLSGGMMSRSMLGVK